MRIKPLNLFYEEPDGDRWFPFDRYPRRLIRRLVRGKPRVSGQRRVFVNLCAGLDRLGVPYRVNDYRYLRQHPREVACVLGKAYVVDRLKSPNPIVFGPGTATHPSDDPKLLERLPISRVVVPSEWVRKKYEPYYGRNVVVWPTGIDTDKWAPASTDVKDVDVLLYDKIYWERAQYEQNLIEPIRRELQARNLRVETIRYGFYREEDFHHLLARSRSAIVLSAHESQGIAYQQMLSCDVPLLAWDRGGYWQDPDYYPHRVQFSPVTSVPYWDERCGLKFQNAGEFPAQFDKFWKQVIAGGLHPRAYVVENLTLEKCAQRYLEMVESVEAESESTIT